MRHLLICNWWILLMIPAEVYAAKPLADFQKEIKPFLTEHCLRCHGKQTAEADLRIDLLRNNWEGDREYSETGHWNQIRYRLLMQEMPPADQPQPEQASRQKVIRWLTQMLRKAGVSLMEPSDHYLPKHANKVDHQMLFDGSVRQPASTTGRLWRVSPHAYQAMMKGELAKNAKGVAQPFSELTGSGLKDYSDAFSIDEATTGQLIRNARAIVAAQTRGELKEGKWVAKGYPQPVKEMVALFNSTIQPPDEELKRKAIARQFQMVLKRLPTEEEELRFIEFLEHNIETAGMITGVRTTMTAVLLLPEAVFRFELGDGTPDEHGRTMLAPRELSFAIAYALTDKPPENQLLRTAAEGRLATRDEVRGEVQRILADKKISKPRLLRFFREYFGYGKATEVFKDKELNPHHRADLLVSDTDRLIEWILEKDQDVFKELMTTRKSFVNYRKDQKRGTVMPSQPKNLIHTSYGLPPDWKWTPAQPVDLPAGERSGILTQPSWLVANSGNFDNHPILRGKWIREHLLGGTVADLPITVDAQLPEEPEHTLRHRLRVTREKYCWTCHQMMNPLGLAFETFDHFGRYRTLERVVDLEATEKNVDKRGKSLGTVPRSVPVNAQGMVDFTGDAELEMTYNNAVDMIQQLARTDHARQVFIRHVFRYFMGRNETLNDSSTLINADRAYLDSGGSFRALVTSLLTSDSFLLRIDGFADDPGNRIAP